MRLTKRAASSYVVAILLSFPALKAAENAVESTRARLWRNPVDIASRDLFYGAGGKKHFPSGGFRFIDEDKEGSNPKFTVEDSSGVKWKVKLGAEARSETAATRLAWAAGYFTDEDYLLPEIKVEGMPKLHRGHDLVRPDGTMYNARLERRAGNGKNIGSWKWRDAQFEGSREFNGLRVLMALVNNWDLKDENNAVYVDKESAGNEAALETYAVGDMGASFGAPGFAWPNRKSRDNLQSYSASKFIKRVDEEYVDFTSPGRPALLRIVALPNYISRLRMQKLGSRIPRAHAKWMGDLLGRLSTRQINDAFRGAGYSPAEILGFTAVVKDRIAELKGL
jgi:hypothetical protein